jgi:hypothetical protein
MRRICLARLILLTVLAGVSLAQDAASEAQIRAVVADQVVAWNAGDGHAYAGQLAPDASFTNLFGMVMYGAPLSRNDIPRSLSTWYRGTTKSRVMRRLRLLHLTLRSWISITKCVALRLRPVVSSCHPMAS